MTDAELQWVVDRLQLWLGRPFTGAWQPARDRVVLGIGESNLLLVPRGPFARVHPMTSRPKNPPRPFSFQGALRARVRGHLTAATRWPDDRIVELAFGEQVLHLRVTGRSGGLWLIDTGSVVAAFDGPAPDALPEPPSAGRIPRAHIRFDAQGDDFAPERWFSRAERDRRESDRRGALKASLTRQIDRKRRLIDGLRSDLDSAALAPKIRRQADALAANLHRFRRGAAIAVVNDLEDESITWELPLDTTRPPSFVLERMYAKASRLERGADRVVENIDRAETQIREYTDRILRLDAATEEELAALEKSLPKSASRAAEAAARPWTEWTGPRGETVLVGKNADSNRRLTFNVAKGDDFWLHVRGTPGAHVIVKLPRGKTPDLALLLSAAQLALAASGIVNGAAADVQYTRVRNVRAIPGKPGLVTVHEERVLHVTRDRDALAGWVSE